MDIASDLCCFQKYDFCCFPLLQNVDFVFIYYLLSIYFELIIIDIYVLNEKDVTQKEPTMEDLKYFY